MKAIKLNAKIGEKEELWILPLARLMWTRRTGSLLHLYFEDELLFVAEDPDGALMEELSRALEVSNGIYALWGSWRILGR